MITVLVADDHALVRHSISDLLGQAPDLTVVAQCEDGDQVLDAVLLHRPDIALLDVQMARTSGLDAARQVRAASDTRVLVVTGSWTPALLSDAAEAGASGVVLKGQDPLLLPDVVRRVAAGGTAFDLDRR